MNSLVMVLSGGSKVGTWDYTEWRLYGAIIILTKINRLRMSSRQPFIKKRLNPDCDEKYKKLPRRNIKEVETALDGVNHQINNYRNRKRKFEIPKLQKVFQERPKSLDSCKLSLIPSVFAGESKKIKFFILLTAVQIKIDHKSRLRLRMSSALIRITAEFS